MCVKLPPRDLNLDPCPPYLTNIYTCGVTTAQRVHGGDYKKSYTRCNLNPSHIYIYIYIHTHIYNFG